MKLLATLCAFALALGGGGDDKDKAVTSVKLRHAASVRGMEVTIGDLCELPGDAAGAALARLRFGAAPNHGFTRTVVRTDVVQALAAAGVDLTKVKVEGADEAVLQTVHVEVSGQELLEAATAALQAQLAVEGGDVEFEPTGTTRVVHAPPGRQSQDLSARLRGARTGVNSAVVEVGSSSTRMSPALTLWPSVTSIVRTTPVSRGCIILMRPLGMILPGATATMSTVPT